MSPPRPKKRSRAGTKATKATKSAALPKELNEAEEDMMEVEQSPVIVRSKQASSRTNAAAPKVAKSTTTVAKSKAAQRGRSLDPEIQEGDTEQTRLDSDLGPKEPMSKKETHAQHTSRTRQEPVYRRWAGSASENERGDPNLRRKLGDITRKFENVELKYRNLKEIGINEANVNMDKLRKQCDVTMQASNELIVSLKKELAAQAPLAQEARKLQKQMQSQEAEVNKVREAAAELSSSLHAAENEIKALQAKLAAARTSSLENTNTKAPTSAVKAKAQRPAMIGTAEAVQAAQCAQMKEDLYSDLTGLIIRGVKKTDEGDTYDCIQTGRNGSE
jgi:chromosome segregation ATPase